MADVIKLLAYSAEDGWNLRGVHPSVTAALEAAAIEALGFRYVAVVLVHDQEVSILRTNARHLLRFVPLSGGFRRAALAF